MRRMAEKGMLFNGDMVRAIQGGVKTNTRRLDGLANVNTAPDEWVLQDFSKDPELLMRDKNSKEKVVVKRGLIATFESIEIGECYLNIKCPWEPGHILYVRETHFVAKGKYYYRADDFHKNLDAMFGKPFFKWIPSIHMPREAARIFLKVTGVRCERLQEITGHDAEKEGCLPCIGLSACGGGCESCHSDNPRLWFKKLWDSLYSGKGYGWEQNPWIWVIEFERTEKP